MCEDQAVQLLDLSYIALLFWRIQIDINTGKLHNACCLIVIPLKSPQDCDA